MENLTYEESDKELRKLIKESIHYMMDYVHSGIEEDIVKDFIGRIVIKAEQIVRSEQIDMIAGRCKADHGDKTFREFIEMGGDDCPICLKKELKGYMEAYDRVAKLRDDYKKKLNEARERISILESGFA